MKISNERKLTDLQEEFNSYYPYLKIKFYKVAHKDGQPTEERELLDTSMTVGEVSQLPSLGYMPLHSDQKVGAFEQHFHHTFGLNVQVFRKSYGKWLQTWATDIWTLDEQNNRGRIMGDRRA